MNRLITLFFILILTQASILAQQRTRSKKSKTNVEKFVLAPFPEAIDSDSIKVVTFMEIPYHALQFVKKENSFLAHYQASLSIRHKKGKEIGNMIWTDSIEVNLYTDTRSTMKNKKHYTDFNVPIGDQYEIIAELQDLDTRKKGILSKKVDFRSLEKTPSLLRPMFLLDLPGDWGFGNGSVQA